MWGEPSFCGGGRYEPFDFNSLAPCGANHDRLDDRDHSRSISTHSPRVGRTYEDSWGYGWGQTFQLTRPVWGEPWSARRSSSRSRFQLTRPVWGEPETNTVFAIVIINFNSLAPCGANPLSKPSKPSKLDISTHSPRVGRTAKRVAPRKRNRISTHSPRVGRTLARRDLVR